jgi:hypothetical protein
MLFCKELAVTHIKFDDTRSRKLRNVPPIVLISKVINSQQKVPFNTVTPSSPFSFSVHDNLRNVIGFLTIRAFLRGKPIAVWSMPFGLPLLFTLVGILILGQDWTDTGSSISSARECVVYCGMQKH